MLMYPVTTLEEALEALQRAFACQAVVQDATESLYHDIPAVNDAGALYRDGQEVGTFAILRIRSNGQDRVVNMRVGAVGELCADPDTWTHFEEWVKTLEHY